MLQYLSASIVYPVTAAPLINGVIAMEADGTIHSILSAESAKEQGIENIRHYNAALIPGLVNTHCHLELSHLFQKIPPHTGLQSFVQQVMKYRGTGDDVVLEAMKQADEEMYRNGIVAVGDISNLPVSKATKLESRLFYHTFVETLGFDPEKAAAVMERALQMKAAFSPLKASIIPHAPYSISKELFAEIRDYTASHENLISMHNQETVDENLFFEQKQGAFLKLYAFLGLDISFFEATGKSSLQSVLPALPSGKVLLVHNTLTNEADIRFANARHKHLFWCLCPNANLYIEQRLPQVQLFRDAGLKITLGTDSLASNHQLSILAEMKTLQEQQGLPFEELLSWGTLNGAEFLGLEGQLGSFEPGKKPGINLIEGMEGQIITASTTIRRLI
ncbi:amidohydrolase family protein [Pedobacter immunditicola]|uniref:amidohydrolase family protein n=1 Tax=Pedobacter immunditicola TaxID=3133440 RepID=UPI0030B664EA